MEPTACPFRLIHLFNFINLHLALIPPLKSPLDAHRVARLDCWPNQLHRSRGCPLQHQHGLQHSPMIPFRVRTPRRRGRGLSSPFPLPTFWGGGWPRRGRGEWVFPPPKTERGTSTHFSSFLHSAGYSRFSITVFAVIRFVFQTNGFEGSFWRPLIRGSSRSLLPSDYFDRNIHFLISLN